jgi:hypothetical protein
MQNPRRRERLEHVKHTPLWESFPGFLFPLYTPRAEPLGDPTMPFPDVGCMLEARW